MAPNQHRAAGRSPHKARGGCRHRRSCPPLGGAGTARSRPKPIRPAAYGGRVRFERFDGIASAGSLATHFRRADQHRLETIFQYSNKDRDCHSTNRSLCREQHVLPHSILRERRQKRNRTGKLIVLSSHIAWQVRDGPAQVSELLCQRLPGAGEIGSTLISLDLIGPDELGKLKESTV